MNFKDFKKVILLTLFLFIGGCFNNGTLITITKKADDSVLADLPFPIAVGYTWEF